MAATTLRTRVGDGRTITDDMCTQRCPEKPQNATRKKTKGVTISPTAPCYVLVKYECIESHMRRRSLTHESVSETARTRLPHRAPRTHPAPPGGQLDNTDTHTQQLFPRRYIIDKMHVTA